LAGEEAALAYAVDVDHPPDSDLLTFDPAQRQVDEYRRRRSKTN